MAQLQDQVINFRVVSVKQESALAKTYHLEPVDGGTVNYKPGQFLTFIIHSGQQELRRSYSILSLPGEPLQITVKKVENGAISRYILQQWHPGDIITSLKPAGRFTLQLQQGYPRDIFCFAAGSGIIPIIPQIRLLLEKERQSSVHLVYSNHNENEALFLEDLEKLAARYPSFTITNFFSSPVERQSELGHLSNISAEAYVTRNLRHEKEKAVFLLCGPFTYMRMLQITLGFMHFHKEQILRENYVPELLRAGNIHHPSFPDRNVVLRIHGQEHLLNVKSGTDILSTALHQGIQLPYSCRGGVCGNCIAQCKYGSVHMSINEVLSETDIKNGWVLTCTGFPEVNNTEIEYS